METLPVLLTPESIKDLVPEGTISTRAIRSACADGSLPATKIGRRWFIPRDKFFEFMNGGDAKNE